MIGQMQWSPLTLLCTRVGVGEHDPPCFLIFFVIFLWAFELKICFVPIFSILNIYFNNFPVNYPSGFIFTP